MADKNLSGAPPAFLLPQQNGRIGLTAPKFSLLSHHNGSLEASVGHSPSSTSAVSHSATSSKASSSNFRTLRTLGGLMAPGPCPEGSSRPRGQSLSSALSSKTRTTSSTTKRRTSQQEEPEALLDLILECQGQRIEDQRASLSLLPDPGKAALCGACSPDKPDLVDQADLLTVDFYYTLIHYQSDRMDDQRCSLPDLQDVLHSVPEGQEDFFSLVQRVQSRRMDEQRASLQRHTAGSSHHHLRHHHPH